ncbi:hypothetical protein [Paenibacillus bovis]|uniref:Uncharacterized protein n=1 Tax=Paenibacillus bovis TaxID=1616788 RepID=A0A172ZF95_9BACL|nr:hypothetical protein [Paenibacillus bovis]ANF96305.1 hypothetical protein AR543_10025 [Paenibacillus bovis]
MSLHQLTYTLQSGETTYTNEAINASVIVDLITELNDYIVLNPSVPLESSIYLQAAQIGGDQDLVMEIRLQHEEGRFSHYSRITGDRTEIIQVFLAYWGQQQLPDLSGWQDITGEF